VSPRTPEATPGARSHALDALRGFALCGIHIANIYQQVVFAGTGSTSGMPTFVRLGFYERFLPALRLGAAAPGQEPRSPRRCDLPLAEQRVVTSRMGSRAGAGQLTGKYLLA
jgi:hypothetical protein